jgi:hypothetical protein
VWKEEERRKAVPVHAMKAYRGTRGVDPLTLALDGGEWLTSRPSRFTPKEVVPVPTEQETGWGPECTKKNTYFKASHMLMPIAFK